jgi:hypothetical protein
VILFRFVVVLGTAVLGGWLLYLGMSSDVSQISDVRQAVYAQVTAAAGLILLALSATSIVILAAIDSAAHDLREELAEAISTLAVKANTGETAKAE